MKIYVDQEKIGSGKTKEAFKVLICLLLKDYFVSSNFLLQIRISNANDLYAGKRFYYIGDGSFTVKQRRQ